MAGYTRQSIADIINGSEVTAPPLNAEFNQVAAAFNGATGHSHDGSTGNSPKIDLATSVSGYLPAVNGGFGGKNNFAATTNPLATDDAGDGYAPGSMWENTTTGRVFICVGNTSNAAVWRELVQVQTANKIIPEATDTVDLGEPSTRFQDLWLSGGLSASGNGSLGGTLTVTGATALGSTLAVTGDATFGNLTATGTTVITSVDLNSGAIDNAAIGTTTPAAGTFTTLNANTSLTAATADINGGTIDGATIGATSHTTGKFTTLQSTGQATLNTVDINGGNIDGTVIGAVGTAAGSFTTLSTSGQGTFATVDINGGTIDGATIGATSASTITGTTITGTSLVGPVTGNVTGNTAGTHTGPVTGAVTGNLTGNVTSSGTSTFNNVTIDGTLNMNAGTSATITNLSAPTNDNDAARKIDVDNAVANLVDSAPGTLDTLNELAAALGDDADFSTTITNSIATKLPLAGGTMTGAIAMSANKITGVGDPTAAQDVSSKAYTDQQDALQVTKSGDSMSGNLAMGSNNITGLATPTANDHAVNKSYADNILGSSTAAATSASNAATSESNAATSETNAANSATAAAGSASSAAASYDDFDDRYLGAKSSAPTVDNDGDALIVGALYFNSTSNIMYVYGGAGWQAAGSSVNGTSDRNTYTATAGQTVFAATYDTGYVDVYLNGVKLIAGTDFTATNGTSITLTTGAAVNDVVDIVAYGTFVLADHYTKLQSDARYVEVAGDTMTGNLNVTGTVTADGLTVDGDGYFGGSTVGGTDYPLRIQNTDAGIAAGVGIEFSIDGGNDVIGSTIRSDRTGSAYHQSALTFATRRANGSGIVDAAKIDQNGDISFYEDTGTTPKFFWDASAESLGIGTTSPATKFDVQGVASTLGLTVIGGGAATGYIGEITNNSGAAGSRDGLKVETILSNSTTKILTAASNSIDRLVVTGAGNVGIGTSSPTTALTVSTDGTEQLTINRADASINTGNTVGTILFTGDDPSANQTGARIQIIAAENWSTNAYGSHITFSNDNSGTLTERMRIESGGALLVTSNDIKSSISGTYYLNGANGTAGNPSYVTYSFVDDANTGMYRSGADTLNFATGGSERMRIDQYGGLTIKSVNTTAAAFGGTNVVNGITAVPSVAGTPFVLGRDTGTTRSAHFGGHLKFDSGYGIDFSATSNGSGTTTSEVLDDYEEGTHDLIVYGSVSGTKTFTYNGSVQGLRYTKIGNKVFCELLINNQSLPTYTGDLRFSLPYTSAGGAFESISGDLYFYPVQTWDSYNNFTGLTSRLGSSNNHLSIGIKIVDTDRQIILGHGNSNTSGATVYLRFSFSYTAA